MASNAPARRVGVPKRQSSFGHVENEDSGRTVPKPTGHTKEKKGVASKPRYTANKTTSTNQKKNNKEDYDQDAEKNFDRMLEGKMDNLPHLPKSMVRVFISSTFSDMHGERNTLATAVFPLLQKFCAGLNLDFQVVDLRWGLTENSQNDHSVEKICLQEVQNCQKMSLGPNFVAIIGDRYGFRPIPTEMDVKMFETLRAIAKDKNINGGQLMDVWYQLDENSVPPQYVLQPIRSQFPYFGDFSPGCDELRAKDTKNWQTTFNELQSALREAATEACNTKKLTNEQLHEYFLSVTEIEIRKGILESKDPGSHVSLFHRDISGFHNLEDQLSRRYVDCKIQNEKYVVDEDVKMLQGILDKKIKNVLNKANIHEYEVMWREEGLVENHYRSPYLQKFCGDFCNMLLGQIQKAVRDRHSKIRRSEYYSDYQEIIHHLQFCQIKCETFCGRDKVLSRAKQYIMDSSVRKPLVLHAPSGVGKTAVMAMIMKRLSAWFGNAKYVGVIRFIGTSAQSSNIYDVLWSICGQLADIADIIMEPVGYKNMKNLVEYMPRFLRRIASTLKCPIVILLDSLDQLSKQNNAYSLWWLQTKLPSNVKLLVSTLPKEHAILESIRKVIPDEEAYLEVPFLEEKTVKEMIDLYLKQKKRTLTLTQKQLLLNSFSLSPGPLLLKLMLDEAAKWNSYSPGHDLVLQDTVQGAINQLFNNLEKKFGKVVVSRVIGYITVSKNGISENELEDVLSCDDEALDDVYRYHNPPVEGIVRIPPVIAARIRYDIKEYLVERISQDKYTINWYHRQFIETATLRYASGKDGEVLHRNLCEIFMAENGVKRDITLTRRQFSVPDADRQVKSQPITEQNKRMLTCLPYHIIQAGNEISKQVAKTKCFCNFTFLLAKLSAYNVDVFVSELNDYLDRNEDSELEMLKDVLLILKKDPVSGKNIAVSMLAHINCQEGDICMKNLLTQAKTFLLSGKEPTLIPVYPCLATRQDSPSYLTETYNDILGIISGAGDSVLLQAVNLSDGDNMEDYYKVLRITSGEFEDIFVPADTISDSYPLLDRGGNTIVFDTKESISLITVGEEHLLTRTYKEISSDSSGGSKKVLALIHSSDTSHVVIHFDNGDIMLIEVTGLKHVGTWTLLEEEEDIAGILCTSIDNLKVIVAVKSEAKNSCGKFRIFKPGQENDILVNVKKPFADGMLGLSSSEQLITYASNSEASSSVISINNENHSFVSDIAVTGSVKQLSLDRTTPIAGIVTERGEVSIVDLTKGVCICKLLLKSMFTQIAFSWTYCLAIVGDDKGRVRFYDTRTGQHCEEVQAHDDPVKEIVVLDDYLMSIGEDKELKIWSLEELVEHTKQKNQSNSTAIEGLLAETDIINFDTHPKMPILVTASRNKVIKLWSIENVALQGEMEFDFVADKLQIAAGEVCVVLEKESEKLNIIDLTFLNTLSVDVPTNVLDFTLNKEKTIIYTISKNDKLLYITEIDLSLRKVKKKFPLKSGLQFEVHSITLSESGRYLVISTKIESKKYKEFEVSWKNTRKRLLVPQGHPQSFNAVDVSEGTGFLMQLNRTLIKSPHLAETVQPLIGNIVVVATRTWALSWDIPTSKTKTLLSRTENDFKKKGTESLKNIFGKMTGIGTDNGYLLIQNVNSSGLQTKQKSKPLSIAMAAVFLTVMSPDCCWVAASSSKNKISVFDEKTGSEVFKVNIGSEIRKIAFSFDSRYLLVLCGVRTTRVLIYKLHSGD